MIAPSFSDIFYSNCTKNGFLPIELPESECRVVADSGRARIELDNQTVACDGGKFLFQIDGEIKRRLLGASTTSLSPWPSSPRSSGSKGTRRLPWPGDHGDRLIGE